MEEYQEIKNVVFSGKFPLVLSEADLKEAREIRVYVQVVRLPNSPYFSEKTNPPNGYLGALCFEEDGFICRRESIDFEKQCFIISAISDTQIIPTALCILERESANLALVAQALGVQVFQSPDAYLQKLVPLFPRFTRILFKAYADTGLNVVVQKLKYEKCNTDPNNPPPPPKPKPVAPPPSVQPGNPIPPAIYTPPPPGSGGDYSPFPGDAPGAPPGGVECVVYRVNYTTSDPGNSNVVPVTADIQVFGIVIGGETIPSGSSPGVYDVGLRCGGIPPNACLQGAFVPLLSNTTQQGQVVINSVVPA